MFKIFLKNLIYIDNSKNRLKKHIFVCGHRVLSFYNRKRVSKICNSAYTHYVGIDNNYNLVNKLRLNAGRPQIPDISDFNLLAELKSMGYFTYIPNPGNLGDMLIAASTLNLFHDNHIHYKMFDNMPAKSVVYGGGGIWTPAYKQAWLKFLDVFKKAEKVLILPSSFYDCPELIEILDERFVIFCRERQSYDYLMSANTKAKIILDHDMAFRIGKKYIKQSFYLSDSGLRLLSKITDNNVKDIAFFIRTDTESVDHYHSDMDLSLMAYGNEYTCPDNIHQYARLMLLAINQHSVIVTDRLHVAIAATLLNKTVYMLDNSYGKCSNVFKHSMRCMKHVYFCRKIV